MALYLGKNKIGITKYENLDAELTEQEVILAELEAQVNDFDDKGDFDVESVVDEAKGTQVLVVNGKNDAVEPLDITQNGEYNVVRYKEVNVNVADMLQYMVDQTNSCAHLFYNYNGTSLDIRNLDTSDVTNMDSMFYNCTSLTNLDVSYFDIGNVTTMNNMFRNCYALTSLDLSHFNKNKVVYMESMFNNCNKLITLDLSSFATSSVINMRDMFNGCTALINLNISNWNTSNVITMQRMFQNCKSLTSLDLSGWDMTNVTSNESMFNGCDRALNNVILPSTIKKIDGYFFYHCSKLTEFTCLATEPPTLANTTNCISTATTSIYVPDASVEAYKTATNWSTYADKIKPLSSKGV